MRTFIGLLLISSLTLALGCTQPKATTAAKPATNTAPGDIKPGVIGAGHKGLPGGGDEEKDVTPPVKKDTPPPGPEKKDNSPPAEKKEPPKK